MDASLLCVMVTVTRTDVTLSGEGYHTVNGHSQPAVQSKK